MRGRSTDFERWKLTSIAALAAPLAAGWQSALCTCSFWPKPSCRRCAMSKPRTVADSSGGELGHAPVENRSISGQSPGVGVAASVAHSIVVAGTNGDAGQGDRPGWQWDVALSFASAQRDYVEQVAGALKSRGIRSFYDADEQVGLWGKYLAEELPAIYAEQAAAVVVFISAEYAARDWTRLERRAALNRAVRERREYVLPARFDDTPLPGLLSDMVAMDLRGLPPGAVRRRHRRQAGRFGRHRSGPGREPGSRCRDGAAAGSGPGK